MNSNEKFVLNYKRFEKFEIHENLFQIKMSADCLV